ncbi:MAG: hypothetical protein KA247_00540 [Bacteroidetes bacterium]|nr:hypothetical protein [Bacteroidota bacterium]
MGNQQVLLLILGLLVVAVAIAVGIGQVREYFADNVGDEMQQTLLDQAEQAKIYFGKPKAMGGGGGKFTDYSLPKSLLNSTHVKYTCGGANNNSSIVAFTAASADGRIIIFLSHTVTGFKIHVTGTERYKKYSTQGDIPF